MKSVTGSFFESKVRLERLMENGTQAKCNELYVVNAVTFTDCEAKMNQFISQYTSGEFEILTEAHAKYREIIFSEDCDDTIFYKLKVAFIVLDEKSGKEKKSRVDYLVQGHSVESAKKNLDTFMKDTMIDYKIIAIGESDILDYIE